MRRLVLGVALLLSRSAAACPIADVKLLAASDKSFDRATTRAILDLIQRIAPLDAERARARAPELGRELGGLVPSERYVSVDAFRLAVRLRQLDCAALRGGPINFDLFSEIAREAGNAIRGLDAGAQVPI